MFTAQFAEHILNKLAAHKRLVQLSVSAVVIGDLCRNLYTVSQLAAQRFKEIEEEEHAERVATTASFFKQLATRCHADDGGDFWPAAISQAAGVLPASSSSLASTAAASLASTQPPIKLNILEELLLPNTTTASTTTEHVPTSEIGSKPHYSIEDLSENQDYSQPTTIAIHSAAITPSTPPVIYITWDDVWTHLLHTLQQTVQFVASTVERTGESPLLSAVREQKQWITQVALGTVDSTREWCRGAMLWPQIELQRVSAVRYRVDWHGVTFPVLSTSKLPKNNYGTPLDLTRKL